MDFESLNLKELQDQYKAHLETRGYKPNTVLTASTTCFFLWRKAGKKLFWQVVNSQVFESAAPLVLRSIIQMEICENKDSQVSNYIYHLRTFRRYVEQQKLSEKPNDKSTDRMMIIPSPSLSEAKKYLEDWEKQINYREQESALNLLFHTLCPGNERTENVLLKAVALNDFYSTNIFSIFEVAEHIKKLAIDDRLTTGDVTLVDDLKRVVIRGKEHCFYSFASKYCSHHNEADFPIYDSYVDKVLRYFRDRESFCGFANNELKNYEKFKEILQAFREFYGLQDLNWKQLDRYIWQFGKQYFRKSYKPKSQ